jgi:hypothetical protein
MRRALGTAKGKELYSRRQAMVEPVFADIKQNGGRGGSNVGVGRRFARNGASSRPLTTS